MAAALRPAAMFKPLLSTRYLETGGGVTEEGVVATGRDSGRDWGGARPEAPRALLLPRAPPPTLWGAGLSRLISLQAFCAHKD